MENEENENLEKDNQSQETKEEKVESKEINKEDTPNENSEEENPQENETDNSESNGDEEIPDDSSEEENQEGEKVPDNIPKGEAYTKYIYFKKFKELKEIYSDLLDESIKSLDELDYTPEEGNASNNLKEINRIISEINKSLDQLKIILETNIISTLSLNAIPKIFTNLQQKAILLIERLETINKKII